MNQKTVKELAAICCQALDDKKAIDLKVIDITKVTPIADYFVIASGANENQVQAMADNVDQEMGKAGCEVKQVEGYQGASWILMDFGDIVVHIFDEESRKFYDLERIWRDGEFVDYTTL